MQKFSMMKKPLPQPEKPKPVEQKIIVPVRYYRVPLDRKTIVVIPKIDKE